MAKRKTLEAWLYEALADKDKGVQCSMIALMHMVGSVGKELHSKKTHPDMNVKELAELFRGKAETYAQDLPGNQMFQILAFYGKGEPEAFFPFSLNGNFGESGLATEGPDAKGALQQLMRQNEMQFQLNMRQTISLFEASQRMIDSMSRREEKLLKENHDSLEIMREVILRQVADNHTQKMTEMEYERSTAERKKLMGFIPPLVNTVTGKEIFPQATSDTALVETITESLTEEQVQQLMGILPAELAGPLANRMLQHMEKKKREQAAKMKELPPLDPENELS